MIHSQALPGGPVGLWSPGSGGLTHIGGDSFIATPWVWWSNGSAIPFKPDQKGPHEIYCCNGSVVVHKDPCCDFLK